MHNAKKAISTQLCHAIYPLILKGKKKRVNFLETRVEKRDGDGRQKSSGPFATLSIRREDRKATKIRSVFHRQQFQPEIKAWSRIACLFPRWSTVNPLKRGEREIPLPAGARTCQDREKEKKGGGGGGRNRPRALASQNLEKRRIAVFSILSNGRRCSLFIHQ